MIIYDYETFRYDVLLGTLDTDTNEIVQVWGVKPIKELIEKHLKNIWVGYNSEHMINRCLKEY